MLGHRVAASSTIGTFLRAFGYGHARQLDAATRRLLARAVAAGAHAGLEESVTIDIDSTLCETYGLGKDGARKVMRTGRRGYHPLLAVIAGTQGPAGISGVIAHARLRRGRSSDATSAPRSGRLTSNRRSRVPQTSAQRETFDSACTELVSGPCSQLITARRGPRRLNSRVGPPKRSLARRASTRPAPR